MSFPSDHTTTEADSISPADMFESEARFAPGGFRREAPTDDGFTPAGGVPPAATAGRPTSLARRPKGRLVVGLLLLVICVLVGRGLWGVFFQYRAYGLVGGRVAMVAAPWAGIVTETHAGEAEEFEQNDLLVKLDSIQLRHQLEQLYDQLRMAQANLDAQISKLKWEAQDLADLSLRATAQQYEAEGQLAEEQALLTRLKRDLGRANRLKDEQVITTEAWDFATLSEIGQQEKVQLLQTSVAEWRERARLVLSLADHGSDQLKPQLTAISNLQAEIARVRELLNAGQLRAPFDAVVIKRLKLVGERVQPQEPVAEILQVDSLEVVLYMSQDDVSHLDTGDQVRLHVEPYAKPVTCQVIRKGSRLVTPPPVIERFYWSNEHLLPVYLEPAPEHDDWMSFRLGSVVKLAH